MVKAGGGVKWGGGGEGGVTRGREVALLQVHGAIEECYEDSHEEAGQVVGGTPPVHHCPLLHQLIHLHHTDTLLLTALSATMPALPVHCVMFLRHEACVYPALCLARDIGTVWLCITT